MSLDLENIWNYFLSNDIQHNDISINGGNAIINTSFADAISEFNKSENIKGGINLLLNYAHKITIFDEPNISSQLHN